MTNPPNAADPTPASNIPPAPPAYGASQPSSDASSYSSAPAASYGAQESGPVPGKTLGIVAFILSFFLQLIALILGIVALVQSKKAGYKNGWAVAAIIISAVLMVLGVILLIAFGGLIFGGLAAACAELGPGTHALEGGGTITCS